MEHDEAQWPATGTPEKRAEEIVRHLEALIPLIGGAPEIDAARGRLEELGSEPQGKEVLTRVVAGLRADAAFELEPISIQEILRPDPIRQTDATAGGLVRTVSTVRLRAEPPAVAAAIFDHQWSWWANGKVLDWQRNEVIRFILKPVSTGSFGYLSLPAKVGIELSAAEETVESTRDGRYSRAKTFYRTKFYKDFHGPGRYEIVAVAGGSLLRSVWDGVERRALTVKMLPMKLFLRVHLGGEKGDLGWPLPPGTGFPGLIDLVQRTSG